MADLSAADKRRLHDARLVHTFVDLQISHDDDAEKAFRELAKIVASDSLFDGYDLAARDALRIFCNARHADAKVTLDDIIVGVMKTLSEEEGRPPPPQEEDPRPRKRARAAAQDSDDDSDSDDGDGDDDGDDDECDCMTCACFLCDNNRWRQPCHEGIAVHHAQCPHKHTRAEAQDAEDDAHEHDAHERETGGCLVCRRRAQKIADDHRANRAHRYRDGTVSYCAQCPRNA